MDTTITEDGQHASSKALAAPAARTAVTPAAASTALSTIRPSEVPGSISEPSLLEISTHAAHLAAFQHTVLPVARQQLQDGHVRVSELRRCGRQLATILYWMDRHLTGDAHAARWPGKHLAQEVRAAMADYAGRERKLMDDLADVLDEAGIAGLARSYHRAALAAPTRPHPQLTYSGFAGRLTFRLAAFVDDVRDGTDNRPAAAVVCAHAAQALHELEAAMPAQHDRIDAAVADRPSHAIGSAATPALAGS